MLIPKGYAFSNEIVQKTGMNISNFSMLKKEIIDNDIPNVILEYGNCTFFNTKSPYLPKYIKEASKDYTDMHNYIVTSFVTKELSTSKKFLLKALKPYEAKEVKLFNKSFIYINDELYNKLENKIITNIDYKDLKDCLDNNDIEGFIELKKDNYLVWYSV